LKINDRQDRRALVFLAVLMVHLIVLVAAIRAARLVYSPKRPYEPLVLLLLRDPAPPTQEVLPPSAPSSGARVAKQKHVQDNAITVPPEVRAQPKIDWEHEAQLAVQNGLAAAEREKTYRDLAGLSTAQLSWVRQNRMVPAPPGIAWHHPRFEFDKSTGLPVFWVNDHCVLITVLIFCGIGHIESNGELFKHMRDPPEP
jgi:hypothetical protein